ARGRAAGRAEGPPGHPCGRDASPGGRAAASAPPPAGAGARGGRAVSPGVAAVLSRLCSSRRGQPPTCYDRAMTASAHRGVLAAALGTIAFVLLVPGTVMVLVPYLLTGWRLAQPLLGWNATRWLGVALLVLALPVFALFNLRFVI